MGAGDLVNNYNLAANKAATAGAEEGVKNSNKQSQQRLEDYLKGQSQKREIGNLQDMQKKGLLAPGQAGGSGDTHIGPDFGMKAGPGEASKLAKMADSKYKPINDQLDSSRATLENLNLGNSTGDKLALINEARLGMAGSGGKAIGQMVALLAGDRTMASDSQKALNWLQNTPNIPTLQPAQRDAIREAVFARQGQVQNQHQQSIQQLMALGSSVAPHSDYQTILKSYSDPVQQKIGQLGQMQQEYQSGRAKMQQPQNPVSQPSQANPNPTTLDRLRSFFGGRPSNPEPQAPQAPQQSSMGAQDPIAAELAKRLQQPSGP